MTVFTSRRGIILGRDKARFQEPAAPTGRPCALTSPGCRGGCGAAFRGMTTCIRRAKQGAAVAYGSGSHSNWCNGLESETAQWAQQQSARRVAVRGRAWPRPRVTYYSFGRVFLATTVSTIHRQRRDRVDRLRLSGARRRRFQARQRHTDPLLPLWAGAYFWFGKAFRATTGSTPVRFNRGASTYGTSLYRNRLSPGRQHEGVH